MTESDTMRLILQQSSGDVRLFRNSVGLFWAGTPVRLKSGDVLLKNPRAVQCGLCPGSSDLIGWVSRTITAADVGQTVAVFAAVEVKSATGKASAVQRQFIGVVSDMGGVAGVARSVDDAMKILK